MDEPHVPDPEYVNSLVPTAQAVAGSAPVNPYAAPPGYQAPITGPTRDQILTMINSFPPLPKITAPRTMWSKWLYKVISESTGQRCNDGG